MSERGDTKTISEQAFEFPPPIRTSIRELLKGLHHSHEALEPVLDAPAYLSKRTHADGRTDHILIVDAPLSGPSLARFLDHASPAEDQQSIQGILTDWQLMRTALKHPEQSTTGDRRLQIMHARGLGKSWVRFLAEIDRYIGALRDIPESKIADAQLKTNLVTAEGLLDQVCRVVKKRSNAMVRGWGAKLIREHLSGLRNVERKTRLRELIDYMNKTMPVSDKRNSPHAENEKNLVREFIQTVFRSPETIARFREKEPNLADTLFFSVVSTYFLQQQLRVEGQPTTVWEERSQAASKPSRSHVQSPRYAVEHFEQPIGTGRIVTYELSHGEGGALVYKLIRESDAARGIRPMLYWTSGGGSDFKRTLHNEIPVSARVAGIEKRYLQDSSLILGALMLVNLYPDAKEEWPERRTLQGTQGANLENQGGQVMGAAQIPVLVTLQMTTEDGRTFDATSDIQRAAESLFDAAERLAR